MGLIINLTARCIQLQGLAERNSAVSCRITTPWSESSPDTTPLNSSRKKWIIRQHSSRERKRRRSKLKTLRGQRRMSLRNIEPTQKINKTAVFTCALHFESDDHDSVAIKQDDRTKSEVDRLEQNQRPVWLGTWLRRAPRQPSTLMVR